MRSLLIAVPLSLLMWWGIYELIAEYGFDAFAFVIVVGASAYIVATIKRDWKPITQGEWESGDTTGYGDAPR